MKPITIKDNNLVITIPLKQEIYNPYSDEVEGEIDNITGVIEGDKVGFAYLIDRSYKDKSPDLGTMFYEDYMEHQEFKKLCEELGVGIWEIPMCAYCNEPLYSSFYMGEKGYMCYSCEQLEAKEKAKIDFETNLDKLYEEKSKDII
jgi:hypothetical protein